MECLYVKSGAKRGVSGELAGKTRPAMKAFPMHKSGVSEIVLAGSADGQIGKL
jgi:hypothetical protein